MPESWEPVFVIRTRIPTNRPKGGFAGSGGVPGQTAEASSRTSSRVTCSP